MVLAVIESATLNIISNTKHDRTKNTDSHYRIITNKYDRKKHTVSSNRFIIINYNKIKRSVSSYRIITTKTTKQMGLAVTNQHN